MCEILMVYVRALGWWFVFIRIVHVYEKHMSYESHLYPIKKNYKAKSFKTIYLIKWTSWSYNLQTWKWMGYGYYNNLIMIIMQSCLDT